jgi:hypothetical protein
MQDERALAGMEHGAQKALGDSAVTELVHAAIGGLDTARQQVKAIALDGL